MKTLIENYVEQIKKLNEGENWTGESFSSKLKSVTERKAFTQPLPGKHSVAEILWHCIYWRKVALKRMQGDFEFEKKTEKEQNFLSPESLKQKGWKNLLEELEKKNELFINFLKSKNDEFLQIEYSPEYNHNYLIEGIIAHDYYHLGQIGFVIALLGN